MQGILKSNHRKLCDSLHDVKETLPAPDYRLNELESELCAVFSNYLQKMNDLKEMVQLYEEKKKQISNVIKKIRKYSLEVSKKSEQVALSKASALILYLVSLDIIYRCFPIGLTLT